MVSTRENIAHQAGTGYLVDFDIQASEMQVRTPVHGECPYGNLRYKEPLHVFFFPIGNRIGPKLSAH